MHRAIVNNHNKTTNMQKTVLQKIIDHFTRLYSHDPVTQTMTNVLITKLDQCLSDERAQIEQAYMDGGTTNDSVTSSDYFTSKYGKDGTE